MECWSRVEYWSIGVLSADRPIHSRRFTYFISPASLRFIFQYSITPLLRLCSDYSVCLGSVNNSRTSSSLAASS